MKPALSVIFFTVASGAGLGLLIWVAALDLAGAATSTRFALAALAVGIVLTTIGLLSSTLHLANRKNAWRAFSQWKRSWLSREAIAAVLVYPIVAGYAMTIANGSATRGLFALLTIVIALAVLYCTGMIYACLKTIPRWNHRLVPAGYLALGLYSGALAGLGIAATLEGLSRGQVLAALALALIAGAVKVAYYIRFDAPRTNYSLDSALSLPAAKTRLLDVGHTHGTFLTDEFCFRLARDRAARIRAAALVFGFVVPVALVLVAGAISAMPLVVAAALLCLVGLAAERWLFFAEAEHVVRLYHGATRV